MRIRPLIRVLRPRETHAEQHQARGQQAVADPVEPRYLLGQSQGALQGPRWWPIRKGADDGGDDEAGHGDVEIVAEAIGVAVSIQGAADQEATDGSEGVSDHDGSLSPGPPTPGQNLGRHSVEQGLGTECQPQNREAGDGHAHAGSTRDDDRAHRAEETEDDQKPLPPPIIGRLGHNGPQDYGENGNGRRDPCDLVGALEVSRNRLAKLQGRVGWSVWTVMWNEGEGNGSYSPHLSRPRQRFAHSRSARWRRLRGRS